MQSMVSNPIKGVKRVVEAATALRNVLRDPDDTKQFFRFIDALGSRAPAGFTARFALSRPGARLLADRPNILDRLQDRARLASLPPKSLGRAYLEFMQRDGLTPEFLVEASNVERDGETLADEADYIGRRMRDTHDLWHTLTGYKGDIVGELSLLAFGFAQMGNLGVAFLILTGLAGSALAGGRQGASGLVDPRVFQNRAIILGGFVRGLRARWLPVTDWVSLLEQPLEDVRKKLAVGAVPEYEPVRA